MTVPLTSLECELLERVAQERDEQAITVLADYWIERVDEARGSFVQINTGENRERADLADEEARLSAHTYRWRAAALTAGFSERDLVIADGFVQYPLCLDADVLQNIVNGDPMPPVELPPRIRGALAPGFAREPAKRPPAIQLRKWIFDAARDEKIEIGPHVIARRLVELGVPC